MSPSIPRRALVPLLALVLAGHWLALTQLPLAGGGGQERDVDTLAFNTRMLAPSPPPPPAAAAPPPAPAPPRPVRRPRPAPKPAPQPAAPPEMTPDPPAVASRAVSPMDDELAPAAAEPGGADAVAAGPELEPQGATAPAPADPASAPTATASAVAEPAAPAALAPTPEPAATTAKSTDVEIRPPGAGGMPVLNAMPPVRIPAPARLSFQVQGQARRLQYHASAELVWRQDGQRYQARQEVKAFLIGSRSQSSTGRITAHGLQPERFGDKARSERAAHFDFAKGEVTFSANSPSAAIHEGAQDRLSVFIQLGAMLAAAPERYPSGTQIALTTVGVKSADRWAFTVQGPQTLELPAGPTPALKLQRVPPADKDYEQKAELWLGTELGYLPVRIRITQANGDFADLLLSEYGAP